jgi:glutathione synthase/RimK-type ligase-like ATP-grasp enzyme
MKVLFTFTAAKDKYNELMTVFKNQMKSIDDSVEISDAQGLENVEIFSKENGVEMLINGISANEYDLILNYKTTQNYSIASLIAHYCNHNGIKIINEADHYFYRLGKILQKVILGSNDILVPRFYFHSDASKYNYEHLKSFLGDKFVAKQSMAQLGKKVFLIETEDDFNNLKEILVHDIDDHGLWLFEEFIQHDFSIRGFVTGDTCPVAIKVSTEKDSFKTNHGEAEFYMNEDKQLEEMCVKAAKLIKLDISGVDTITAKNGNVYILEVNKAPGITIDKGHSLEADAILNLILNRTNGK